MMPTLLSLMAPIFKTPSHHGANFVVNGGTPGVTIDNKVGI